MDRKQEKITDNKLWIARKCAGYSQKQVADLLGVSLSLISQYEKGRKLPSLGIGLKIEHIYGRPLSALYPKLYASNTEEVTAKRRSLPFLVREQEGASDHEPAQCFEGSPSKGGSSPARTAIHPSPCDQPLPPACLH